MAPNASLDLPVGASASLPHLAIVDKLQELSLVNSALGYANERYAALKASSTLVNSTLERAETTITAVVTTGIVPAVLNKFEQPIYYADNIAVQGLDYIVAKIGVITKQSEELKDSATKVVDQTKERAMSTLVSVKASAVQTVQARVHTVLTLPSNAVPLLEQILSAGESVLDYFLPEVKHVANGTPPAPGTSTEEANAADTKAFIRLVISRMRQFTDKVHRRVVDFFRERWMPALKTAARLLMSPPGKPLFDYFFATRVLALYRFATDAELADDNLYERRLDILFLCYEHLPLPSPLPLNYVLPRPIAGQRVPGQGTGYIMFVTVTQCRHAFAYFSRPNFNERGVLPAFYSEELFLRRILN